MIKHGYRVYRTHRCGRDGPECRRLGDHTWIQDAPTVPVGQTYELTGFTFSVQLETFAAAVTGGRLDFLILNGNGDLLPTMTLIPEPSSLALLCLGGLAVSLRRRRF